MIKKFAILLLAIFFASCVSNDKFNRHYATKIPVEKLKKDIRYAHKNLKRMQPDLYWYISKEALDYKFDSLEQSINQPLTPNEFYLKLSPVIASIHQAHTSLSPMLPIVADSLKKRYKGSTNPAMRVKYEFKDEKLYIKEVSGKKTGPLQKGAEVLSINHISPQEIYTTYKASLTSDGYNQTFIPKLFARNFNNYLIAELGFLDSIQYKVACGDTIATHTLHRIFKEKKKKKTKEETKIAKTPTPSKPSQPKEAIDKLSKAELKAKKAELKRKENEIQRKRLWYGYNKTTQLFSKEVSFPTPQDSSVALLKIRNFTEGRIKVYDEIFANFKQKKIDYLILDLRGNTGGALADIYRLSQFLNSETYQLVQPSTLTSRTTFFNLFKGDYGIWKYIGAPGISSIALWKTITAYKNEEGEIKSNSRYNKSTNPKPDAFTGPLYVITDGMTFSAAAIISSHLKGRPQTTFVGDETGGTFNGTVAGIMPILKLPHSKLKLRVGLMTVKPSIQTEENGYGVKPDVYINPSIDELIEEIDPELQWILEDIAQKKSLSN